MTRAELLYELNRLTDKLDAIDEVIQALNPLAERSEFVRLMDMYFRTTDDLLQTSIQLEGSPPRLIAMHKSILFMTPPIEEAVPEDWHDTDVDKYLNPRHDLLNILHGYAERRVRKALDDNML